MSDHTFSSRAQEIVWLIDSYDAYSVNGGPIFREFKKLTGSLVVYGVDDDGERIEEFELDAAMLDSALVLGSTVELAGVFTQGRLSLALYSLSLEQPPELNHPCSLEGFSHHAYRISKLWSDTERIPAGDLRLLQKGAEQILSGGVSPGAERVLRRIVESNSDEALDGDLHPRRWPDLIRKAADGDFDPVVADTGADRSLKVHLDNGEILDLGSEKAPESRTFSGFDVEFRSIVVGTGREVWCPNRLWHDPRKDQWRIVISHGQGVFDKSIDDAFARPEVLAEAVAELFGAMAELDSVWQYSKRPRSPGKQPLIPTGTTGVNILPVIRSNHAPTLSVQSQQSIVVDGRHRQIRNSHASISARDYHHNPDRSQQKLNHALQEAICLRAHWRRRRELGGRVTNPVTVEELDPAEVSRVNPPEMDLRSLFSVLEQRQKEKPVPTKLSETPLTELMNGFEGHPLFDHHGDFHLMLEHGTDLYPTLERFLSAMPGDAKKQWWAACRYLEKFTGNRQTFSRYRGELQRLMLFLWLYRGKGIDDADESDIDAYLAFIEAPPASWQSRSTVRGFRIEGAVRGPVSQWRPFLTGIRATSEIQALVRRLVRSVHEAK